MAEEDAKMIEKYKNGIKEIDRVTEEIYESRLAVCKECELLNAGTVVPADVMWNFGLLQK